MDGRLTHFSRIAVLALTTSCLFWGAANRAEAAYFTAVPATYNASGAGPFKYSFLTSGSGMYGGVAYKLSTSSTWHSCQARGGNVTLSNLADGTYGLAIADDINPEDLARRGLGIGSMGCGSGTGIGGRTSHTFYVDTIAPSVGAPSVTTSGKTAQVVVSTSDATSGISRLEWSTGDGGFATTAGTQQVISHTYRDYGSYGGTVRVTDRAGNSSSAAFRVELKAPAVSPPLLTPSKSVQNQDDDAAAPTLTASSARFWAARELSKKFGRSYRKGQKRQIECRSRLSRLRRSCNVYWRYKAWRYRGKVTVRDADHEGSALFVTSLHIVRTGEPCDSKSCRRVYR